MEKNVDVHNLAKELCTNDLQNNIKKLEKDQIEFKNELVLRRDQVERLSKDLDNANLEKYQLKRSLEKVKATLKQNESTVGILMKQCESQDEKLKQLNEALVGMKLSQDLKSIEVEGLHKFNQDVVREKVVLTRQIEELRAKSKYYGKIQSDFDQFQSNLDKMVAKIKTQTEKLEVEHNVLKRIASHQTLDEANGRAQFFHEQYQILKKEKFKLEVDLSQIRAKYDKLESLLKTSELPIEENLVNKLILNQWRKSFENSKTQNDHNLKIITKITEALNEEKSTCTKVISKNDQLELDIIELKAKLAKYEATGAIKDEIIEIE